VTDFSALQSRLTGNLTTPADPDYTAGVEAFNSLIRHRPDAVVRAADETDVVETVRFARAEGVPIRLHATGHGARYPYESGILLVVSELAEVTVDSDARTATFGGGTRAGAVVAAAAEHGLAPVIGSSTNVGFTGLLVGGGLGHLARSHGFCSDQVVAARVVTGEGEVVVAAADGDADLLWAIRGGKFGLGVITEVTVSLVEVPSLYAGTLFFDLAESTEPFARWIEWTASAPDAVTTIGKLFRYPDVEPVPAPLRGKHLFPLHVTYPGSVEDGERLTAPLRELGSVYLDQLGPLPIADVARISNDPVTPMPAYIRGLTLAKADRGFADAMLSLAGPGSQLPIMGVELRHLGAATRRDVAGGTAVGHRDFAFTLGVFGVPDPALFDEVLPRTFDQLEDALAPWISPHQTPNWAGDLRVESEVDRTWPSDVRDRLDAVRSTHDPDRVFA
jgi:FAD binding domain